MIKVYWDDPQETIVRLDYSDPVKDWEEYHAAVRQANDMARSKAPATVHMLHNPGSTKMPKGNALGNVRRAMAQIPENTGYITMVITDVFAKSVIEVILRLVMHKNARFARSLTEAHELIRLWHESKQGARSGG